VSQLLDLHVSPEDEELARKRAKLGELESKLADRELELAATTADLIHFEQKYLRWVGRRYAKIDELKARIAEAHAKQNPKAKDAQEKAYQARVQAEESAKAVGDEKTDGTSLDDESTTKKTPQSDSLKKLYRQAAKLLHPDLTLDGDEKNKRTRIMADLNDAYAKGDEERVKSILRDWHAAPESVQGDGTAMELIRVIRKIAQVEKRLRTITDELERMKDVELSKLKKQVDESFSDGRNLIRELCERLDHEIVDLLARLKQVREGS
jgi:hypothetical protein